MPVVPQTIAMVNSHSSSCWQPGCGYVSAVALCDAPAWPSLSQLAKRLCAGQAIPASHCQVSSTASCFRVQAQQRISLRGMIQRCHGALPIRFRLLVRHQHLVVVATLVCGAYVVERCHWWQYRTVVCEPDMWRMCSASPGSLDLG
jgi:hypothetical protein